jgi:hypothetical protein
LQEAAAKKTADWETLARALDAKLARLLPCDPRSRADIDDVSRASEARLAALQLYLQTAAAEAKRDAQAARAALTEQEIATREMETERAEAQQERVAIEGQLADLTESAKHRESLESARKKLEGIAAAARQRVANTEQQAARRAALNKSLGGLASAYESRQRAMEAEVSTLAIETLRWSDYYSARILRAQTECTITDSSPRKKK